ncbi:hypothetical protein TIFTF001_020997 [Ficus carica]|uniref:Uncharacterized protein n=1 Tax=Ficus carica TaxID=3494 RepID=A0AA88DBG1_FICCA|nr:hypothetical protein TIFTF001_020997 [Ficus carica]
MISTRTTTNGCPDLSSLLVGVVIYGRQGEYGTDIQGREAGETQE